MEFRLLGPLEVSERERLVALGGLKQRSLLAILLLHANELVSTDRLHAELWGDAAPVTAAKSIQVYVSRLRKELGADRLTTRAPGYVLHVDASEFDVARFQRLREEARRAEPTAAARKLREALALWRGGALADLAYEPFAQIEIARLEELRLVALEERIDADLATGRDAELIGDLEALVAEHPLRERLRGQLMLALYRSARQAEALHAYQVARRELSDELGLEPSGELKRLEQAILQQDPALEPSARPLPAEQAGAHGRAVLAFAAALDGLEALLGLAAPLAVASPQRELIVTAIVAPTNVGAATAALAERADELRVGGLATRIAAFSSPTPGADIARMVAQQGVDLVLASVGGAPLEGESRVILEQAPCDVALLLRAGGSLRAGPIVVPFGAAHHDWAALELGAWVARATSAPLRLIGAASDAAAERSRREPSAGRRFADRPAPGGHRGRAAAGHARPPGRRRVGRRRRSARGRALRTAGTRRVWAGCGRRSPAPRLRRPCSCVAGRGARRSHAGRPAHALRLVADGRSPMSGQHRSGRDVRRLSGGVGDRPRRHGRRLPRARTCRSSARSR